MMGSAQSAPGPRSLTSAVCVVGEQPASVMTAAIASAVTRPMHTATIVPFC